MVLYFELCYLSMYYQHVFILKASRNQLTEIEKCGCGLINQKHNLLFNHILHEFYSKVVVFSSNKFKLL